MKHPIWKAAVAALIMAAPCSHAAPNSVERLAAIAQLPNWSGVWKVTGATSSLSGNKSNLPSYNASWQGKTAVKGQQDTAQRYCAIAIPRLLGAAQPFEIIVTPEETIVYYSSREIRHIWTDGRDHPPEDERWPMYWAESKGHWEGQTLVVDTINVHGNLWLDASGATLSDDARIQERISMVNANTLRNDITITDVTALSKPWSFTRSYTRQSQQELTDQGCQWNAGQASK